MSIECNEQHRKMGSIISDIRFALCVVFRFAEEDTGRNQ